MDKFVGELVDRWMYNQVLSAENIDQFPTNIQENDWK